MGVCGQTEPPLPPPIRVGHELRPLHTLHKGNKRINMLAMQS